jgi:hypothetical protein
MLRKRPCRVCGKWFYPNVRAGDRQKVCSGAACQRERHRRNCSKYHLRQLPQVQEERVRRRIRKDGNPEKKTGVDSSVLGQLDWQVVRDSVGAQSAVIIQETGRLVENELRDLVRAEVTKIKEEFHRLLPFRRRDDMVKPRPPP